MRYNTEAPPHANTPLQSFFFFLLSFENKKHNKHGSAVSFVTSEAHLLQKFMEMDVPPSTASSDSEDEDDSVDDYGGEGDRRTLRARGQSKWAPIAVVGAGPAGLTCATYLSRLGYRRITVYESGKHAGGLRYVHRQILRAP